MGSDQMNKIELEIVEKSHNYSYIGLGSFTRFLFPGELKFWKLFWWKYELNLYFDIPRLKREKLYIFNLW